MREINVSCDIYHNIIIILFNFFLFNKVKNHHCHHHHDFMLLPKWDGDKKNGNKLTSTHKKDRLSSSKYLNKAVEVECCVYMYKKSSKLNDKNPLDPT